MAYKINILSLEKEPDIQTESYVETRYGLYLSLLDVKR